MTTALRILVAVTAGALSTLQGETPPASLERLAEEVKGLRKELLQDLLDRQSERVGALEEALDRIHREGAKIDHALESQEKEFLTWNQELQTSELPTQERAQAAAAKRAANDEEAQQLRSSRTAVYGREAAFVQRLSREKERLRRLHDALAALER
jgi:hypothetical protein